MINFRQANLSWLTLRDLEYLVSVAEHKHFGKAALNTHVTQPALSSQIRKVENQLGVQLFERSNRKVALTLLGERVVHQARIVLEEAAKIRELTELESKPLSSRLRIGSIATVGPYFIPHLIPLIKKTYPQLDLFLKEGLTETLLSELHAGQLDAVIASPTFDNHGLDSIPLYFEPFYLALPSQHPLLKKKPIQISDLKTNEMVLLEDGHCLRDQVIETCAPRHRGLVKQFHATSLETIRQLVASSLGYTLMPALAVENPSHFRKGQFQELVRYRKFDATSVGRWIILVFRKRFTRMQDMKVLAELIKKNLPSGVQPRMT